VTVQAASAGGDGGGEGGGGRGGDWAVRMNAIKRVLITFASFIGPGFMVCFLLLRGYMSNSLPGTFTSPEFGSGQRFF
jgi:hypothetical protein